MGFLGPNGAGKTTVMNIAAGLLHPDEGAIELLGIHGGARGRDARLRLGYLQEKPRIYPEMSARAYLDFFARLYGVAEPAKRVAAVIERVGLGAVANQTLGTFSRGMQQRACLARVMLHKPEFLMLDEPTLGLDPSGVVDMRDIFRDMRAQGTTLFFSSHQLSEMERICDRVAFMNKGRLIALGRPADLVPAQGSSRTFRVELFEPAGSAVRAIGELTSVVDARETADHLVEVVVDEVSDIRKVRATLARDLTGIGLTVLSISTATASLEDLFLAFAEKDSARRIGG